jgi:COMPASS component SWD2
VFTNAVDAPTQDGTVKKTPSSAQITGLSFDDRGETLVTAGGDETFKLYNIKSGKYVSFIFKTLDSSTNKSSLEDM